MEMREARRKEKKAIEVLQSNYTDKTVSLDQ